jgi:thioredoxin-like negative regulator of GroEL
VAYADALFDRGRYPEALSIYEALLRATSDNNKLVFKLALCLRAAGNLVGARDALAALVGRNIAYSNYRAVLELASVEQSLGNHDPAIDLLRRACAQTQRLELRLELARALTLRGNESDSDELDALVEDILHDFKTAPLFYRRKNRELFRSTKRLRREMRAPFSGAPLHPVR